MRRFSLILLCCFSACAFSAAAPVQPHVWQEVPRVVAVGDIHGAYTELRQLLADIGLIDAQNNWTGGTTHLVSLGDLLDRGPQSRQVMDLLQSLQQQAAKAGGRVHVLLGNHEIMNLTGDLRDVSAAEFAAFGGADGHAQAFALAGEYAEWLLGLPAAIQINDSLFMHGGVSEVFTSIAEMNRRARQGVITLKRIAEQRGVVEAVPDAPPEAPATRPLPVHAVSLFDIAADGVNAHLGAQFFATQADAVFGEFGPFWYRGNVLCHALLEEPLLSPVLHRLGVARVIVGHTPTRGREVLQRLGGKVLAIDTGMLSKVYRGNARALEISDQGLRVLGAGAPATPVDLDQRAQDHEQLLQTAQLGRADDDTWVLSHADRILPIDVLSLSGKQRRKTLAAYQLDRWLQLGLVAAVAERQVDNKTRLIQFADPRVSETQRTFSSPNYCQRGSVFDLVAAFDSLIGMTRTGDNLQYSARTREVVLVDHGNAFTTARSIPQYASPPSLAAPLRERLLGLTQEGLTRRLGHVLKKGEIKALLQRRDLIVAWPDL